MTITRSSLLVTLLAVAAPACGNRLLVGEDPDGGPPPTGTAGTGVTTTGTAGTGVTTTGTAGTGNTTTGAAGTGGPPHPGRQVTPLQITGEQAVSRLAAVIWRAQPDEDLLAPAREGHFPTTEALHDPVRQLLADPRAKAGLGAFYRWWLDLDRLTGNVTSDPTAFKDQGLFPEFTPALAADMATETETFAVNVTLDPNGTYQMLMTAPFTFATERLAAIYGVAGVTGNLAFQRIQLDPQQRAGLLTQPSQQALTSFKKRNAPSHRGTEVLTRFLCKAIPQPPAGLPEPPPITFGQTTRQWLAEAASGAPCATCHVLIDPPGLEFETFDPIGRWRTMDNGAPVDVSGLEIRALSTPRMPIGPVEFARTLAISPEAEDCMVRQWLHWALQRDLTAADDASVAQALSTFRAEGYNLKELIFAVLTTDAFLKP